MTFGQLAGKDCHVQVQGQIKLTAQTQDILLASFGDGVISATIALLLILNLLAGIVVSVPNVLRARYRA